MFGCQQGKGCGTTTKPNIPRRQIENFYRNNACQRSRCSPRRPKTTELHQASVLRADCRRPDTRLALRRLAANRYASAEANGGIHPAGQCPALQVVPARFRRINPSLIAGCRAMRVMLCVLSRLVASRMAGYCAATANAQRCAGTADRRLQPLKTDSEQGRELGRRRYRHREGGQSPTG
jgi:hypothetical protein